MAVIRRYNTPKHPGQSGREVFIEVDGKIVGSIEKGANQRYVAATKGWIPMIDGISGMSLNDVWSKIVVRVRSGGVYFVSTQSITDIID